MNSKYLKGGLSALVLFISVFFQVFSQDEMIAHHHGEKVDEEALRKEFLYKVEHPLDFSKDEKVARFTENKGQWDDEIKFRTELINGYVYFEGNKLKYHFVDKSGLYNALHEGADTVTIRQHAVEVSFRNANPSPQITPSETYKQQAELSYHNQRGSFSGIKQYGNLKYQEIYPNIDLVYSSFLSYLKYEFIVKSGGNPDLIQMDYKGADKIYLHENGTLVIESSIGGIAEYKPFVYQWIDGDKREVESSFSLNGNIVSFQLSEYDTTKDLIIDPGLIASTYTGSTSDNWGVTAAHTMDGKMIVAGVTVGNGYPTTVGAFQTSFQGGSGTYVGYSSYPFDISVSVFSADGTTLLASSFLGGSDDETPHSLVVDSSNNLFIMGKTLSTDFPMAGASYDNSHNGREDIFVAKMSSNLSTLIASTFVGGSRDDGRNGSGARYATNNTNQRTRISYGDAHRGQIVQDANGDLYVTSSTRSHNFPTTSGAYDVTYNGNQDAVVFKIDSALTTLSYSTFLGGNRLDAGFSIAVDTINEVYVTGMTSSNNFPTTGGVIDNSYNGNSDAFLTKLSTVSGTPVFRSTYLGTSNKDGGCYVAVNSNRDVFVYGASFGGAWPVTGGTYVNPNTCQFIASYDSLLATTNLSTTFGSGSSNPNISPTGFAIDSCDKIVLAGWGRSLDFGGAGGSTNGMPITPGAYQTTTDGQDFYLAVFNPDVTNLLYATFIGDPTQEDHVDGGTSTFDNKGFIYQAVCASCGGHNSFPTTAGAYSSNNNASNCNNAVFKFDLGVFSPGAAVIGATGGGCKGVPVSFTNNSTNSVSYLWDFGDGSPTETTFEPTHTYTSSGNFTVTLIAYNPSTCITSDTTQVVVSINQPIVTVTTNPTGGSICNGNSVTLTASGANAYSWTYGANSYNGNPLTDNPSITTNYKVVGTDLTGCKDSVITTITVDAPPTLANAGVDSIICSDITSFTMYGNSPSVGTGNWTLVSGAGTITNPSSPTTTVTNLGIGNNVFEWTISNGSCTASSDQMIITVNQVPATPLATSNSPICSGSGTLNLSASNEAGAIYSWSGPNGFTSSVQNPSIPSATVADSGTYSVTTTVSGCMSSPGTVSVVVSACPPSANDDVSGTNLVEDGANGTIDIISNDTDTDGTPSAPTNGAGQYVVDLDPSTPGIQTSFSDATGTWTYDPSTGNVTFNPANNYNGTATITYELTDPEGNSDQGNITFVVDPVNDAPSQGNESITVQEDETNPTTVDVTGNNVDPDGTTVTFSGVVSTTGGGTVTDNGDGTVDYVPAPNFNGVDTVVYTVCDNGTPLPAICVNDTLFVTVTPVNDPPIVDNEYHTILVDTPVSGDLTDAGDFDLDGNLVVTTTPLGGPNNGSIVINPDGSYTYTPNSGFVGNDTIIVEICDDGTPLPIICTTDTIFIIVNSCDVADPLSDCDGDGVTNGQELTDNTDPLNSCDFVVGSISTTPDMNWMSSDCDGDGVTNGDEYGGTDGDPLTTNDNTNPQDDCDYNSAQITVVVSSTADCDGDGVTNADEILDNTEPFNPCDYQITSVTLGQGGNWNLADCDGDGVTNADEELDNTNPFDPCDLIVASQTVTPSSTWLTSDCDGDGVDNGTEVNGTTDPFAPCDPVQAPGYTGYDAGNPVWANADCDGDGELNGDEISANIPSDPYCDNSTITNPMGICCDPTDMTLDCDGDGVTNGDEITDNTNPNDPCDFILASVTLSPDADWLTSDCDGDGVTNGDEIVGVDPMTQGDETNPLDECDFNVSQITLPISSSADCDGDGVTNADEITDGTDPFNPCEYNTVSVSVAQSSVWNTLDCDGDGVINVDEINGIDGDSLTTNDNTDPNDPCSYNAGQITVVVTSQADCDGDGVTNADEIADGTDPFNPCDLVLASQTVVPSTVWYETDCDNDGLTNEEEVSGIDNGTTPDNPNGNITDPLNPDTDGDGVTDGTEGTDNTNPNDPCEYLVGSVTLPQGGDWLTSDCDGDGVSNGQEITDSTDVSNPCDLIVANQDVTPDTTWLNNDCDNDGLTNGEETTGVDDPNTPDNPNGNITDPLNPDTDGDGVTDGVESVDGTNPNDPCDLILANQNVTPNQDWNDNDCDNDGLTNGEETSGIDNPLTSANPNGGITDPFDADTDGDGVIDGTEANDETNPNDPCSFNDASITLEITADAPCQISIPEGFSPNGDGVNDLFVIEGLEKYDQVKLVILNRWGNKVYESNAYKNDWDGTNKFGLTVGGKKLPTSTYFYIVDLGDGSKPIKGYVYLSR